MRAERDSKAGQAEAGVGVGGGSVGNGRRNDEGARVHWPETKAGHQ